MFIRSEAARLSMSVGVCGCLCLYAVPLMEIIHLKMFYFEFLMPLIVRSYVVGVQPETS